MRYTLLPLLFLTVLLALCAAVCPPLDGTVVFADGNDLILPVPTPKTIETPKPVVVPEFVDAEFDGAEVVKTDAQWKKVLAPASFDVMRKEGTEAPYSGALLKNHKDGIYYCAACHLAIFRSKAKYDSQTGWPSFYEPIYKKNVVEKEDKSLGETRTEVQCARCKAHLGHVFDDGPQPTGLRYCMNSVALIFKPVKAAKAAK